MGSLFPLAAAGSVTADLRPALPQQRASQQRRLALQQRARLHTLQLQVSRAKPPNDLSNFSYSDRVRISLLLQNGSSNFQTSCSLNCHFFHSIAAEQTNTCNATVLW
jgi:hypothetical protein